MKIRTRRNRLLEVLDAASRTVPKTTTLPVLSCVLLEAEGDSVHVTATDLDLTTQFELPGSVERDGSLAVELKRLLKASRAAPAGSDVLLEAGDSRLKLTSGDLAVVIGGIEAVEFPRLPDFGTEGAVQVRTANLQQLIGRTSFAASTEESRPILNGILCQISDARMTFTATNGHRLARATTDLEEDGCVEHTMIVPPRAAEESIRLFEFEPVVHISWARSHFTATTPSRVLCSRLIEGPYPDVESVIPREFKCEARLDSGRLLDLVRRLNRIRRDESGRLQLHFSEGRMSMYAGGTEVEASDSLKVAYRGQPSEIRLNSVYLQSILDHCPPGYLSVRWNGPTEAVSFVPEDEEVLFLQMPLRSTDDS